ncbi:MFS transporter [Rhodococcus sp. G-MC3]|uniref:MFS transporter n=1 Tax=Rhodococcus sp. G-MC3 TaxID=3046209 RepID=UPI0024BA6F7A|nr:MFS transporter [Rhodococcus sp. G-MC3]MDJ0396754.1 MFS transporter [Rhodococcus sp. G-MC3]
MPQGLADESSGARPALLQTAVVGSVRARSWWTLAIVCGAVFMLMLDMTIVAAALPSIQASFRTSLSGLQWVIDAYTLPVAALLMTTATLGDRIGRRRLFLAGIVIFTIASAGCAVAADISWLNASRSVQGIGAALLLGVSLPLIAAEFPEAHRRARAIGIYGAVLASATALGPLVGGALVDALGWQSIFLINLPVGVITFVFATKRIGESVDASGEPVDWAGTALLTTGLFTGVLALIEGNTWGWQSPGVLALAVTAGSSLTGFTAWQLRSAHPMLDLRLLLRPAFGSLVICAFCSAATLIAATNYFALYLMNALDFTPLQAGLRILPLTLAGLVSAPIAALTHHRVAARWSIPLSLVSIAAGMELCSRVGAHASWVEFIPGLVLAGLGLGAAIALTAQFALGSVTESRSGMATGMINSARQIGIAVGVAGLGAMFTRTVVAAAEPMLGHLPVGTLSVAVLPEQGAALTEALGAGAGLRILDAVPAQFEMAKPALADVALTTTSSGLGTVMSVGAGAAAVAAVISFIALRWRSTPE